jgi:thymidylate kinase
VERMASTHQDHWLIKILTRIENQYYQQILPPDVLIVLKVDPEIAVQRKTNEDKDSVRPRAAEIWDLDWRQTFVHVVDANQSAPEVLSRLKDLIWSNL